MRALVTGAGGFLGRYIVEQLVARGDHVRAFSRREYPELTALGVEPAVGDIRDAAAVGRACAGREIVFHTAAIAGIFGPWEEFYGINTLGTQHVLSGCRAAGIGRLVFTSSPSVTFDGTDQCDVDESAPYPKRWLCHYPHTKALAEQAVLAANGRDGMQTCALRPHLIWGPRDPHLVPRLLQRARSGQLRRVGDGTNLIDMVYVENAAEAHLLAADALRPGSPVGGRAYFISQGEPVNCWDWINELLQLAGLAPVQRSISTSAAWRVGAVLELAHKVLRRPGEPRMTRFLAAQLGRSHYFNVQRARDDFGYVARISADEGMRRLANSWATG
ncbi:MAG: NAD-dependent epimerase/dehydratase family protein [Planctomycetales bacterium]|nr:NAD-dependent epimerase/dehydratase family protein [Planctomycetales bacterium]MCA9167549.1 NAD-dependent epimerase/dehydratase family protein [Planctomycetales bacterium]